MRKISYILFLLPIFLCLAQPAKATLLTVKGDGEVVWKVLSSEDSLSLATPQRESLTIKEVAVEGDVDSENKISLLRDGEKFRLTVNSIDGQKDLDVTDIKGELVEIEERQEVKKIKIGLQGNQFVIEQEGIIALTDFPIDVTPLKAEISVLTQSGSRFLAVLPKDALDGALKARVLNKINPDGIILSEKDQNLTYDISGFRTLNVFNLFEYDVPVKASVSAVNGEIIFIEQPQWLRVVGFIFG